mgnify:CR=1 FL=1
MIMFQINLKLYQISFQVINLQDMTIIINFNPNFQLDHQYQNHKHFSTSYC